MSDPHNLGRFVEAQEGIYQRAMAEIRSGEKRSHWMWFIFPQLEGLGGSAMSQRYALKSRAEAKAYLEHKILGPRLVECVETLLRLEGRSAREIFGHPDEIKLRSCGTLFAEVSAANSVFHRLLEKYFESRPDPGTLRRL